MTAEPLPIDQQEHQAIVGICVLAAFADGMQGEDERARIQQIVNGFSGEGLDVATVYQDVLGGKLPLATAAGQLQTPSARSRRRRPAHSLMRWPFASATPTAW